MTLAFVVVVVVIGIFSNGRKVAPGAPLELRVARGEVPSAAPGRQFDLRLADSPREGGPFKIEVAGSGGATVWSGLADTTPSGIDVRVLQQLLQGEYFVRVYSADGKMLQEYAFRVR